MTDVEVGSVSSSLWVSVLTATPRTPRPRVAVYTTLRRPRSTTEVAPAPPRVTMGHPNCGRTATWGLAPVLIATVPTTLGGTVFRSRIEAVLVDWLATRASP